MPNPTTRDKIWMHSLKQTYQRGKTVTPADIAELSGASERTVRETMYYISKTGFLDRETLSDGSCRYSCPKYIDIDADVMETVLIHS